MALDTTIGGSSSDSYVTLAEYEAYVVANLDLNFNGHGHDTTHEMHLRRAAQWIDRNYSFTGYQQYEFQSRAWPRRTQLYVDGWPVDTDTIPQDIKDAQMELAYLMEVESLDPAATVSAVVASTRNKAGPVETETQYLGGKATPRIVAIEGLLRPYLAVGQGQYALARA